MFKRSLLLGLLLLITFAASTPWSMSAEEQERIPAFHRAPPPKGTKQAPILGREQLWGTNDQARFQSHAYELAARIGGVLYQQPCYCYCDRMGHKSLRSCFEDTHGAQCTTCMKELYYSYEMTKQQKNAEQIRKGIIQGEWKQIDLESAATMN
ncbi:MAG: hypothetical protein JO159_05835 [Acidobacteria bacterium]|nr:hypothetical protein [Acidobacteriota bacterium]MBV9622629.1 hypothetical protein [Acidobacteriota bacterium]